MVWRCRDVGVCACFGNEGHLYLSVPDRFRFSVSVTVPQMCFLPENKSGTSPLSVSLTDNTGRRQNCAKLTVRATVVFEVECRSLPQHGRPLTSPPCLCFPDQNCRKLTENPGISRWLSNTIKLMQYYKQVWTAVFQRPDFSRQTPPQPLLSQKKKPFLMGATRQKWK